MRDSSALSRQLGELRNGSVGQPSARASAESADGISVRPAPRQILVVEDLPRIQEFIREVVDTPGELSVTGFVTTATEAIEQCISSRPDALIVDLHLASGSGLDVIKAIRRHMTPPHQPLIMVLTNHATPQLEQACRRAGADHFLDKSKDFARVRSILLTAFSNNSRP